MVLGKVLAHAGMMENLNITWIPSYGVEVRGGTAHVMVRISSEHIGNPIVMLTDTAIIMNDPSLDKFENKIKPGGLMILNTSMAKRVSGRTDIETVGLPLTDEAIKLGNVRVANIIAAGIFVAKKKICTKEVMIDVIKEMAGEREHLVPINIKALELGMEMADDTK